MRGSIFFIEKPYGGMADVTKVTHQRHFVPAMDKKMIDLE